MTEQVPAPYRRDRRFDLLLSGGTIVTMDDADTVVERGKIGIVGGRIAHVGGPESHQPLTAYKEIDCDGMIVMPGLVDCHNHLFQSLARGLGEGLSGWEWLSRFMWPYAGSIGPVETRAAAYLGALEAARSGTTSILDHHYGCTDVETTLSVASAVEDVGLRGVIARGMAGPPSGSAVQRGLPHTAFRYSVEEELDMTRECMSAKPPGGSVVVWPGPVNIVYTEPRLILGAAALAQEFGTGWHTHFCAPQQDPEIFWKEHGVRPAAWLARHAALGRASLAHCTWLDDADVEILGRAGVAVAHCPVSNAYVPFGTLRLPELRDAGAVVGLATDGAACGHRQDMFEQMKAAVLMQRLRRLDPRASTAKTALRLATREGARSLGIDAGMIAEGRLADVIVINVRQAHLAPMNDVYATIVYSMRGSDVVTSIVNGRIVVEDGRARVDEAAILEEAQQRSDELVGKLGLRPSQRGRGRPGQPP